LSAFKRHFFIFLLLITAFQVFGKPLEAVNTLVPDTNRAKSEDNTIKSKVHYTATDSIRVDLQNQKIYLYGNAVVYYEQTTMKAAYLEINLKTHVVLAEGKMDSARHMTGKPTVQEAEKTFTAVKMLYNYESKKGKIYEITTQEGDGKILGEAVKKDSTNVYYIENGRYSTCNLDEPHFAIHAHKLKVIVNDKIITGPANLQVMGINTPLAVPFGFFPNKRGRASGILIPTYGESTNQGFFLKDGGYYFGINDNVDLALRGDIYSRGSWGAKAISNYKVRYKYSGNFNISYANTQIETPETKISENNYRITWVHNQDSRSNPSSRFSANVNAATSNFNSYNATRPADYLSNTLQSNISWQKSFVGTPFNLSTNLRHSQNTLTRTVDLSLPDVAFTMNRINPFKFKNAVSESWYDKIGVSATLEAKNDVHTGDSIFFKPQTLKRFQNGAHATIPISAVLRSHFKGKALQPINHISFTPSVTVTDNVYLSTTRERHFANGSKAGGDTVVVDTVPITRNSFEYTLSVAMATKFYGLYTYRHSVIKQIHHVITPLLSFVYKPDYSESRYGYYKTIPTTSYGAYRTYSIFQNGIFGSPSAGLQEMVVLGLGNNLEAKLRPKGDTASKDRRVSLLDNFNISTAYNAAAQHFKWSNISISAQTALFDKHKLNVNVGTTLDPYLMGSDGKDIEKFEINHNNRIGRIINANLSLGTSLRSKDPNAGKPKQSTKGTSEEMEHINLNPNAYIDFNLRWSLSLNYILSYNKSAITNPYVINEVTGLPDQAIIKKEVSQTIRFSGDCNLTPKWKVGFNSGFDMQQGNFSYTSINVYRDLHCWEMAFNWVPFGLRQSYSVDIKVKSAVLQDLKLSRKRDWYDYTN
jgi:hypothetical protein